MPASGSSVRVSSLWLVEPTHTLGKLELHSHIPSCSPCVLCGPDSDAAKRTRPVVLRLLTSTCSLGTSVFRVAAVLPGSSLLERLETVDKEREDCKTSSWKAVAWGTHLPGLEPSRRCPRPVARSCASASRCPFAPSPQDLQPFLAHTTCRPFSFPFSQLLLIPGLHDLREDSTLLSHLFAHLTLRESSLLSTFTVDTSCSVRPDVCFCL